MEHSKFLSQVEKAISGNIDLVCVTRVDKIEITSESVVAVPGKTTQPGEYGVVDRRILLPINESA